MTIIQKLQKKIKDQLNLDVDDIRSLKTGRNQKASGAWSWVCMESGSNREIGCCYPMSMMVKKSINFVIVDSFSGLNNEIEIE